MAVATAIKVGCLLLIASLEGWLSAGCAAVYWPIFRAINRRNISVEQNTLAQETVECPKDCNLTSAISQIHRTLSDQQETTLSGSCFKMPF